MGNANSAEQYVANDPKDCEQVIVETTCLVLVLYGTFCAIAAFVPALRHAQIGEPVVGCVVSADCGILRHCDDGTGECSVHPAAWIIVAFMIVAAFITSLVYFKMPGYYEKRLKQDAPQTRQGDPITLWQRDGALWKKAKDGDVPGVKEELANGAHPNAYNFVPGGHAFHLHILFLFAFNWLFWGSLFWLSMGLLMSGWYRDGVAGGIVLAVVLFLASVAPHGMKDKIIKGGAIPSAPAVYQGRSTLHVASAWGHANVVRVLVLAGAARHAKDRQSHTAADIARLFKKPGWDKCVEVLEKDMESLRVEEAEEEERKAAEEAAEELRIAAAATDSASADSAAETPLVEMVERFKKELGLEGGISEVVSAACKMLDVQTSNLGLKQQAEKCYVVLFGDTLPSAVPHVVGKASPDEEGNPKVEATNEVEVETNEVEPEPDV